MVKDHSDSERGNPLPPHGLLFPISGKWFVFSSSVNIKLAEKLKSASSPFHPNSGRFHLTFADWLKAGCESVPPFPSSFSAYLHHKLYILL